MLSLLEAVPEAPTQRVLNLLAAANRFPVFFARVPVFDLSSAFRLLKSLLLGSGCSHLGPPPGLGLPEAVAPLFSVRFFFKYFVPAPSFVFFPKSGLTPEEPVWAAGGICLLLLVFVQRTPRLSRALPPVPALSEGSSALLPLVRRTPLGVGPHFTFLPGFPCNSSFARGWQTRSPFRRSSSSCS